MEFICEALTISSKVFDPFNQADERAIPVCHKIILQLLAHPDSEVRLQAYKASLSLLKEACSVSHVTEPFSVVCQKAMFILGRAVLHQICCFGIYDEDGKVSLANILISLIILIMMNFLKSYCPKLRIYNECKKVSSVNSLSHLNG